MFGLLGKVAETAIDTVTSPITDSLEVLQGLSEGELRTKAIARLGADVVAGMTTAAIIEALSDE